MVTPMMQQYETAKATCGDAILLFRMGDFYELFHEDARVAAAALGLTLTSRDKSENPVPMAGFPHHQLDSYLAKLIKAGFRVAVCEQVENPATAKGLVRREVTQIVSPGTVTDQSILDPTVSNYLCAVAYPRRASEKVYELGVAWVELSTGQFAATVVDEAWRLLRPGGHFVVVDFPHQPPDRQPTVLGYDRWCDAVYNGEPFAYDFVFGNFAAVLEHRFGRFDTTVVPPGLVAIRVCRKT